MLSQVFSNGLRALALGGLVLCMTVPAASADAIDGEWCNTDGKHITINGPDITLPDGAKLQGNYTRHSFAYTVPESQPAAGTPMIMTLVNENLAVAKAYRGGILPMTWKRCERVS